MLLKEQLKPYFSLSDGINRKDFWIAFIFISAFESFFLSSHQASSFYDFIVGTIFSPFIIWVLPHFILLSAIASGHEEILITLTFSIFLAYSWNLTYRRMKYLGMDLRLSALFFIPIIGVVPMIIVGYATEKVYFKKLIKELFQFSENTSNVGSFSNPAHDIQSNSKPKKTIDMEKFKRIEKHIPSSLHNISLYIYKNSEIFISFFSVPIAISLPFIAMFYIIPIFSNWGNPNHDDFQLELTKYVNIPVEITNVEDCLKSSATGAASRFTDNDKDVVRCFVTYIILVPGTEDYLHKKHEFAHVTMAKAKSGVWHLVGYEFPRQ